MKLRQIYLLCQKRFRKLLSQKLWSALALLSPGIIFERLTYLSHFSAL